MSYNDNMRGLPNVEGPGGPGSSGRHGNRSPLGTGTGSNRELPGNPQDNGEAPHDGSLPLVACCIVAGDDMVEEDRLRGWRRLLDSLVGHVDLICLVWNGKQTEVRNRLWEGCDDVGIPVHTAWEAWEPVDWSRQRNAALELVPEHFSWWMWIDTDDTFHVDGNLKERLAGVPWRQSSLFCAYHYVLDRDTKKTVIEQWRERIFRNDRPWTWVRPVHECVQSLPGTRFHRAEWFWVKHDRWHGEWRDLGGRNRKIMERALREDPRGNAIYLHYMAKEILGDALKLSFDDPSRNEQLMEGIGLLERYMQSDPAHDDGYLANCEVADVWRVLGEYNRAIDVDLQGVKINPSWPDAYVGIAQSCMYLGDWEKTRHWADLALTKAAPPVTTQGVEKFKQRQEPLVLLAMALDNLGRYAEALEAYREAYELLPTEKMATRIAEVEEIVGAEGDTAADEGAGVELVAAAAAPSAPTSDRPRAAFVTLPIFEPWHPLTEEKQGLGGAETCVIRLAHALERRGWDVTVYGIPGHHAGTYEGVDYVFTGDLAPDHEFDVFVGSRAPEITEMKMINDPAKVLWLHDVSSGPRLGEGHFGPRWSHADRIVTLTEWHRAHTAQLYGIPQERLAVIGNGIDADVAWEDIPWGEKQSDRLVYASSPDRGLDHLLYMWGSIRKEFPQAELHVYYGWRSFEKIIVRNPHGPQEQRMAQFRRKVEGMVATYGAEEGGIFWHDRIPQKELHRELLRMGVWAYPTHFMETYCITALEMQMCGVVPVTSRLAALPETVFDGRFLVDGWAGNTSYARQFFGNLVSAIEDPPSLDEMKAAHYFATSRNWDAIAGEWEKLFEELGVGSRDRRAVPA